MVEPRVVRIDWIDVQSIDIGLQHVDDLKEVKPLHASIIGWLVYEDKDNYFVAKEYWKDYDMFKYVHVIPKKTCILKITTLEEANGKSKKKG